MNVSEAIMLFQVTLLHLQAPREDWYYPNVSGPLFQDSTEPLHCIPRYYISEGGARSYKQTQLDISVH